MQIYLHKDALGRYEDVKDDGRDRYLNPTDGRVKELVVQSLRTTESESWTQVPLDTQVAWSTAVLSWTWASIEGDTKAKRFFKDPRLDVAMKWVPACLSLAFLVDLKPLQESVNC